MKVPYERYETSSTKLRLYFTVPQIRLLQVKYGAIEGAPMNVRVNGVAPGTVITPMLAALSEEAKEAMIKDGHLIQKPTMPEDVSDKVICRL